MVWSLFSRRTKDDLLVIDKITQWVAFLKEINILCTEGNYSSAHIKMKFLVEDVLYHMRLNNLSKRIPKKMNDWIY
jgi:hypothetical protein